MATPSVCNVFGTLRYPTGEPVVDNDIEVFVDPTTALPRINQSSILTGKSVILRTDEDGYFESPLMRGALVTLHIKQSNFQCQFAVPDADEVDIETIPGVFGVLRSVENPF
jgi:hypothetical protein